MPETSLVLIRHGETDDNLAGILQGHRNSELNPTGLAQARAAAQRLAAENCSYGVLYSSDLARASVTAGIIGEALKLPVIPVPELREWQLGELEGRPCAELWQSHPAVMEAFRHESPGGIIVPGGESSGEFDQRVIAFLRQLPRRHPGKRLIAVTHGGVLRRIFRHVAGSTAANNLLPLLSNGGFSRIVFRDSGEWQLCTWNDSSHLAGISLRESITF